MTQRITRREAISRTLLAAPWLASAWTPALAAAEPTELLARLEAERGGRLGVAALRVATGHRLEHRGDERFPMASTFKLLAAAFVLARVDRGEERLDRRVDYTAQDLLDYAPVTKEHLETGMTVAELCKAAVTLSDNTAANLLLESFGGPKALTAYARSLGDEATRLDRNEPELNASTPGDPRDTTTPRAMLESVRRTVLGDALSADSRERLTEWLLANETGDARLRAGVPKGWRVGDKTGTASHGVTNDIGVAWPPSGDPVVVVAYYAESTASVEDRSAVLAEVARIVTAP